MSKVHSRQIYGGKVHEEREITGYLRRRRTIGLVITLHTKKVVPPTSRTEH